MEYKVNHLIYALGKGVMNSFRVDITLTETIDPEILKIAISETVPRYPYFAVRLARRGEEYVWESNELPIVISKGRRALTLNSAESNYHAVALAYEGNRLYIDFSHYLTDGTGSFPFIKTLLYCYLSRLHPDEVFDTKGIALPDSEIAEREMTDDPFPDEPVATEAIGSLARPDSVFLPEDQQPGYSSRDRWTTFCIKVKQKDLMQYASSADGSPASFAATLIYRAITDLYRENSLPLVCGMQHQYRRVLGNPYSHLCHVNIIPIVYPDRFKGKSIEYLNTMARGTLVIRADDANDLLTVNDHIRDDKRIRTMTLEEKQAYIQKVVLNGIGTNTFEVSYAGRVPWSGLDRYVTNVKPYIDLSLSGGFSAEIFSFRDEFSITLMQRNEDARVFERIMELMKEIGIDCVAEEPEHFEISDFELPE